MIYIVIEGIDGAGKTEISHRLLHHLTSLGFEAEILRFCGGSQSRVRQVIKKIYQQQTKKFYLHVLQKSQAVEYALNLICGIINLKKLKTKRENEIIIGDRSIISLLVRYPQYIGFTDLLLRIYEYFIPELVIILDTPPDIALKRILDRAAKYTNETGENLFNDRIKYLNLKHSIIKPLIFSKIEYIDSVDNIDYVFSNVKSKVLSYLHSKNYI